MFIVQAFGHTLLFIGDRKNKFNNVDTMFRAPSGASDRCFSISAADFRLASFLDVPSPPIVTQPTLQTMEKLR
jgi:hypothetical protein